jgi:hypothetical protein
MDPSEGPLPSSQACMPHLLLQSYVHTHHFEIVLISCVLKQFLYESFKH